MGTVFTIDIRDPGDWSTAISAVVTWLHRVDDIFSTYQADSPINRLARGEVAVADCPADVATILGVCQELNGLTGGYFSAFSEGKLDPSGYVKGWAIERGSAILREHGSQNHAVNGGGDLQCAGEPAAGQPWRVGVSHPLRPGQVSAVVAVRDGAVATSGTAERGAHIRDPQTGRPAVGLASVTVTGAQLGLVDAYATAAFARGRGSVAWLSGLAGCEALVISATGRYWQSSGFVRVP